MGMKINISVSVAAIILAGMAATGCDFLRKVAGRPTSAQLEAAVAVREAEEQAQHQARLDSARRVAQAVEDSLKAVQAQAVAPVEIRNFIIVGTFSEPKNAEKKKRMLEADGYKVEVFNFRFGKKGVGIEGAVTAAETKRMMQELIRKGVCSQGSWILEKH